MPAATLGGVSIILYGMISAVGVRNMVENHTDFQKSRNVIVAAVILGLALGVNFSERDEYMPNEENSGSLGKF